MNLDDPFARSTGDDSVLDSELPDELIDEIDRSLAEELTPVSDAIPLTMETHAVDADGLSTDLGTRQMQETFLEMSRNTLNPIARYMKAIAQGENARELMEICELVVTPMIPRVEAVGLENHADDLSFYRSLLLLALGERDQSGTQAMREVVMEGFSQFSIRFGLSCRGYRLAVRNLVEFYRALRASDKISEMDVRRFFAAGVSSLTWVRRTPVGELSSLTGIAPDVVTQLRKIAYEYRSVPPMGSAKVSMEDRRAPMPKDIEEFLPKQEEAETQGDVLQETGNTVFPIRGQA